MMDQDKDLQLLDVREKWERDESFIQSSMHQPLGNLIQDYQEFIAKN